MLHKNIVFACLLLFISTCLAQLGTEINSPLSNSTIKPGDKIEIDFGYQNMGTGTYSIDVNVWTDNTLKTLSTSVANDYSIPAGNSTGTQLAFFLNSTYSWTVPHGLNETVYLTVTTNVNLTTNANNYTMRSRAIVLHVNVGLVNIPKWGLIALSFAVLYLTSGF
jgi:hypothetical protein